LNFNENKTETHHSKEDGGAQDKQVPGGLSAVIGHAFLPAVFESRGCIGERFFHFFDRSFMKRADQIGAPVAAFAIY